MSDYFTSVTNTSALRTRTPRPLYNQDKKLPRGSLWAADELTTFRVVVNATNTRILPYLNGNPAPCDDLPRLDPVLVELLQPTPDLAGQTEIDLVSQYGYPLGQFWAALAELVPDKGTYTERNKKKEDGHVLSSPPDQPASKRNRIAVERPGMVNSTQIQIESSSPIELSSQVSSQDDAFVPDDHNPLAREANTERLLTCFVRCILYSISESESDPGARLECRTPLAAAVCTNGGWSIRAEDDGGLRWRPALTTIEHDIQTYYMRSQLADCYHVLFEAKKGFQHIYNGRPTITDNWLGQMTAEALVGRLARAETYYESRYVEHIHTR
ncbi:hypothetical protein RRF57_012957 [Xylaria bambusicola]|uniref:Uncharacterized protein n=1 Tax=Xylaria bambusicola TaxID=326684 RepID=A0AAN7UQR7_9PEZI